MGRRRTGGSARMRGSWPRGERQKTAYVKARGRYHSQYTLLRGLHNPHYCVLAANHRAESGRGECNGNTVFGDGAWTPGSANYNSVGRHGISDCSAHVVAYLCRGGPLPQEGL
jgi:hypothetical protein